MGTTLATYSAFRLVQFIHFLSSVLSPPPPTSLPLCFYYRLLTYAIKLKKPVLLLNVGPTRADGLPGLVKLGVRSGAVLGDVTRAVMYRFKKLYHVIFGCSFIYFFLQVVLEHKMILWLLKCCGAVLRTRRYVMMTCTMRKLPIERFLLSSWYHHDHNSWLT